ncbi:AbiJ-NTD4 domain-containing protein [Salinicoccus roseus]|uniref:AbiJ-NTD4 domain-containing protein n=1 Tax=Salinicoccus roseus TaxID=45670 RepID=UPI002301D21F|nr:hypothetical protein [Salinicoccus roseus]
MKFSQRHGFKNVRDSFQIESIDHRLKTGLWNAMQITCFDGSYNLISPRGTNPVLLEICKSLWRDYFKERLNDFPSSWYDFESKLESDYFHIFSWYEIYDLIEFIASHPICPPDFEPEINKELEKEMSGYRLIDDYITPIVKEVEIAEIEKAINDEKFEFSAKHLAKALEYLSDRSAPDFRNSIKESISAVESTAKVITGNKGELKSALTELEDKLGNDFHPALKQAFLKIYGYTSDSNGIRHALLEEEDLKNEDAKFMLVACSAFINYMIAKTERLSG